MIYTKDKFEILAQQHDALIAALDEFKNREGYGWQHKAAVAIGVTDASISLWIKGDRLPKSSKWAKIIQALEEPKHE